MRERNQGITLIALIITIIILLILATISVNVAIKGGLFEQTGKAVDKTNDKVAQEQSRVDELMGELTKVEQNQCTHEWGEWIITKEATDTEKGTKERTCTKCGKVEIGETTKLVIGAYIEGYDPNVGEGGKTINTSYTSEGPSGNGYGNQTFTVGSITKWRVVGEENGQIIITTVDPIQVDGGTNYYLRGQDGYVNFIEELNKISGIYGQGKHADTSKYNYDLKGTTIGSGGRSITLEDIGCIVNATPSTKTYTKNSETGYIDTDGTAGSSFTKFGYWGEDAYPSQGTEWKELESGESVTIATYGYTTGSITSKQNEMVFKKSDGTNASYWLASRYPYLNSAYVNFDARIVGGGSVGIRSLYGSYGSTDHTCLGVRPAVYLKSDIQLEYDAETGYTIK